MDPFWRSRIWSPEKSVAPAAAISGDIASKESTAVNWVKIVDFLVNDQSKDVILLPWETCKDPKGVVAIAEGESRPFKGNMDDFWRAKASKLEGLVKELVKRDSRP